MDSVVLDMREHLCVLQQGMALIVAKNLCKNAGLIYFEMMQSSFDLILEDLERLENEQA